MLGYPVVSNGNLFHINLAKGARCGAGLSVGRFEAGFKITPLNFHVEGPGLNAQAGFSLGYTGNGSTGYEFLEFLEW